MEVLADWSECALMSGAQRLLKGPREICGIREGDWTLDFGTGMNSSPHEALGMCDEKLE